MLTLSILLSACGPQTTSLMSRNLASDSDSVEPMPFPGLESPRTPSEPGVNPTTGSSSGSSSGSLAEEDEETPETNERISAMWDERRAANNGHWTRHTVEAIEAYGPRLLEVVPADVTSFCPRYNSQTSRENRIQFWVRLISAMAYEESSFNPNLVYTEGFRDSSGERIQSRGLLQISQESGNLYGCGFARPADLDDAARNLSCGVKILNHWLGRDGVIRGSRSVASGNRTRTQWLGGGRYWAVLRFERDLRTIRAATRSLPFCQPAAR